ncbi:hypothetical protein CPC08DRAFT_816927 [Agrocybe pediades]|nr:hypothetical protein CPC08DRAFT_816927 [Agrocybe pediades]
MSTASSKSMDQHVNVLTSQPSEGTNSRDREILQTVLSALRPTMLRVEELNKVQTEMLRTQREILGVVTSLTLRLDSSGALPRHDCGSIPGFPDNAAYGNGTGTGTTDPDATMVEGNEQSCQCSERMNNMKESVLKGVGDAKTDILASVDALSGRIEAAGKDMRMLLEEIAAGAVASLPTSSFHEEPADSGSHAAHPTPVDPPEGLAQQNPRKRRRLEDMLGTEKSDSSSGSRTSAAAQQSRASNDASSSSIITSDDGQHDIGSDLSSSSSAGKNTNHSQETGTPEASSGDPEANEAAAAQNLQNSIIPTSHYQPGAVDSVRNVFLRGLAYIMAKRNIPLPYFLTGVHVPNYDHANSTWNFITPGKGIGYFKLAGNLDVDLFYLWCLVLSAGGLTRVATGEGSWSHILSALNLPDHFSEVQPNGSTSVALLLSQYYCAILYPLEQGP